MLRTTEMGFVRRSWCRSGYITGNFIKGVLGSVALILMVMVLFFHLDLQLPLWCVSFSFPFPTASAGHFCGRTDERSHLCNIHVPAALWEALFFLLLPRTGIHCGFLGWEGKYQVRWLLLPISFWSKNPSVSSLTPLRGGREGESGLEWMPRIHWTLFSQTLLIGNSGCFIKDI